MTRTIARRDGFEISTDPALLDLDLICDFLGGAYWSEGISREKLEASFRNARTFGMYDEEGAQVGFARVLTDGVRFGYLSDVFILDRVRGKGLGKWLMEAIFAHDGLGQVDRWFLATRDAHEFYRPLGFEDIPSGRGMMRSVVKEPS